MNNNEMIDDLNESDSTYANIGGLYWDFKWMESMEE